MDRAENYHMVECKKSLGNLVILKGVEKSEQ